MWKVLAAIAGLAFGGCSASITSSPLVFNGWTTENGPAGYGTQSRLVMSDGTQCTVDYYSARTDLTVWKAGDILVALSIGAERKPGEHSHYARFTAHCSDPPMRARRNA